MSLTPDDAAASLRDISTVHRRTREAAFYGGSSAIFVMWGVLVGCGYAITEIRPWWAPVTWPVVQVVGCIATVLLVARLRGARPGENDWRLIWAMMALVAFGTAWGTLLAPVVPLRMIFVFQPSLVMLGFILAGLWVGRFFIGLGLVGLGLMAIGYAGSEPWFRLWMGVVQSGTLIVGGLWLSRKGITR